MRWTRFFHVMFLLISAVFFVVFVSSGIASAATWTVTSTDDTVTAGTLRYAITYAASGDTIDITATGTILLQSPLPVITKDLTIKGPGAASLKVSGAGIYQVFNIDGATVDISGLTVINGSVPGPGGGIYSIGTLTLTDCTVSGNSADSSGGGIFSQGSLTVTNCTFSDNNLTGEYPIGGGGIYSVGILTVTNSTFSDNNLTGGNPIGGGIFSVGNLAVTNCTFSGNSAGNGGGIFYGGAAVGSVSGDSPTDTYAPSINGPGTSTVTNSTFSDNTANFGGGILNGGGPLLRSPVSGDNPADAYAPSDGILASNLTVTNCTFSGNSATFGGGIYNGPFGLTATNSPSGDNPAGTNVGSLPPSTLTVTNSTFSGNSASEGGGIFNAGTQTVINCTISGNTATTDGGGIYNGPLVFVSPSSGDSSSAASIDTLVPGLENTIVAGNSGGNCGGTVLITSNGYNLEYGDNPATCNFTQPTDRHANPLLDPNGLQNNGGPTRTIALLAGSPAIDAADSGNFPPTDQRGVPRPQGAGPDIGAYEYFPPSTPVPAMDGWGAIVFIILAGLGSVYYLRRRGRAEG